MSPVRVFCYCAFCRSSRRVYVKRHVSYLDVFYALGIGILLSLIIWQEVNFKLLSFSVTLMGIMEIAIQIRWRMNLPCPKCGFDPLLYLKSPAQASDKVRAKYNERMQDPNILDKKLPVMGVLQLAKKELALRAPNTRGQIQENKI